MKIASSELEHLREEVRNCHQIIKDLQMKREWVGLTPEEVKHLYPYGRSVWGRETYEAIEKALKAKNNG
jgi:hypothetical protein